MRIRLALVCAYAFCATMTIAQTDRGSIRGTITDPSSAVLAGATVTATNPATGVSFTAKTTTAGTYNIAALPSGTYRVEVGQPGFTTVRTNVVVDVGNVVGLDLRLEVGSSTQTVSVEAAAPI